MDNVWLWVTETLVGIMVAGLGFWLRSIRDDQKQDRRDFDAMEKTIYRDYATKIELEKVVNPILLKMDNLAAKMEALPEKVMKMLREDR